jgi:HD superfamily phosphohydrolase YqeK
MNSDIQESGVQSSQAPADFSPLIALIEDRPKQSMVFQMNMAVYLGARVVKVGSLEELASLLREPDKVNLIVCRLSFKGDILPPKLVALLQSNKAEVPVIVLGNGEDDIQSPDIHYLEEGGEVKPLLQTAAKILGITAKQMAQKKMDEFYEIPGSYLGLLFSTPCPVYVRKGGDYSLALDEAKGALKDARALASRHKFLFIPSRKRLKFANAFTEQVLKAADELKSGNLSAEQKVPMLAASLDIVSLQFRASGMDEEIVNLAQSSIKAIEQMAETTTSVGNLVKNILESQGGYRYAHCQLITFLGFHIIKMMSWWGDEQRTVFSQAAFYHDICLTSDEEARIHNPEQLAQIQDPEQAELIATHSQLAARELQSGPEISSEVVRLVLQHHGTKTGRGFSAEISTLDHLAKTFLIAEEWADYLISLSETDGKPNNEGKMAELKAKYQDTIAHQIIETLRYLDENSFTADFLAEDEMVRKIAAGEVGVALEDEDEARFSAEVAREDQKKVRGGGDSDQNDLIRVKGASEEGLEPARAKIEGVTEVIKDEITVIKADPKGPENYVLKSLSSGPAEEQKAKELKLKNRGGATELMTAALKGELAVLEAALQNAKDSPELRKTDAEGRTCIHYAAMGGSVPVLKFLIERGVQKNSSDSKRRSPLFLAALYKQNDAFDFLLEQGGRLNQQAIGGMTIAHVAAFSGNLHILQAAAMGGLKFDLRDHSGKTPLDYAKLSKVPEVIQFVESGGKTAES